MTPDLPSEVFDGRIIAVARHLDPKRAADLASVLSNSSIRVLEITMESGSGAQVIGSLAHSDLVIGAGTVTTISQAKEALSAGAQFLVSPHLAEDLVVWAANSGVPLVPGVLTPTELSRALYLGATTVKLFPASALGPEGVKALLGPFPGTSLVPTGGITADNAAAFIEAGARAVGVGGWLTAHQDMGTIAERAQVLSRAVGVT